MPSKKTWAYAAWLLVIAGFAAMHAVNLRADFPNHSPWYMDWAKYTDEGWYGNAAIRAHLTGSWYLAGDFNAAPAVPVWPLMEWMLFLFTGVTLEAARGLAVAVFLVSLGFSYLLLRASGPRWAGLLAVTMLATSPFLYCFSRLATLEPMLILLTLAALNVGVRVAASRKPMRGSVIVGLLFALMMLTKTTAVFLLPALVWAVVAPLRRDWRTGLRFAGVALASFAAAYGLWFAGIVRAGLLPDYKYLFFVNKYPKPIGISWPLVSLWWCLHGSLWVDRILVPLAGLVVVAALLFWKSRLAREIAFDPALGASLLAALGYVGFMTYQDHPQPRYYSVVGWFCCMIVARAAGALLKGYGRMDAVWPRATGWAVVGAAAIAIGINGAWFLDYATHPEYTFVNAAERLTRYIDEHPNGKRLLLSVSGDQIEMVTHLPTINDLFVGPGGGMQDLAGKLAYYRPGWYACWNQLDAGALEDLHTVGTVEQVASFHVFDDPQRNVLVLFKLHSWPDGRVRDEGDEDLGHPFADDRIEIPMQ